MGTVPDAENKHGLKLCDGERVLFAAKTDAFCTETQQTLKWDCKFTMTDKQIVVDGGDKIWRMKIPEDIARFRTVEEGHGLMKIRYAAIDLKKDTEGFIVNAAPNKGYVIYFKKKDMDKLKEITRRLFVSEERYEYSE